MHKPKFLFILLLSLLATISTAQEIFIGGFQDVAPYILKIRENGKPDIITGGIIKEITDEVTFRTGLTFTYFFPPRKRLDIEIAQGTLHVIPMANPAWFSKSDLFLWSSPIFKEKLEFLTLKSFKGSITGFTGLEGLRIGMSEGFVYEAFPTNFNFYREDAATVARNIKRLKEGWIDALYGEELDILYHLKENADLFIVHPWSPSTSVYSWAVSKSLGENGIRIVSTIETMIADGTIEAILAKYR